MFIIVPVCVCQTLSLVENWFVDYWSNFYLINNLNKLVLYTWGIMINMQWGSYKQYWKKHFIVIFECWMNSITYLFIMTCHVLQIEVLDMCCFMDYYLIIQ